MGSDYESGFHDGREAVLQSLVTHFTPLGIKCNAEARSGSSFVADLADEVRLRLADNTPPVVGDETRDEKARQLEALLIWCYRQGGAMPSDADFRKLATDFLAALRSAPEPDWNSDVRLVLSEVATWITLSHHRDGCRNRYGEPCTCGRDSILAKLKFPKSAPETVAPVAWQKCPVCDGQGLVVRPPHIAGDQPTWTSSSTAPYPCRRCAGTGTIYAAPPAPASEERDIQTHAEGEQHAWEGACQMFGVENFDALSALADRLKSAPASGEQRAEVRSIELRLCLNCHRIINRAEWDSHDCAARRTSEGERDNG